MDVKKWALNGNSGIASMYIYVVATHNLMLVFGDAADHKAAFIDLAFRF